MLEVRTLTDGGQRARDVAEGVVRFIAAAHRSLDLALYDYRLSPELDALVGGALREATSRGVAVRFAYNKDHRRPIAVPPPPATDPAAMERLGVPTRAIPGIPDLMHHKYVIRDREAVWTGSANWRDDAWTREENVIVVVGSPQLAEAYTRDFAELWTTGDVARAGRVDPAPAEVDGVTVRPWFSPGRARAMVHRIADAIGHAQRRVRVASPVISSGPILGTLAEVASDPRVDLAGVVDATQVGEVVGQWRARGNRRWKIHLLAALLDQAPFAGKHSTPYGPGTVHDYMHAKLTIADDTVFAGSFNLSHSGEMNAEDVLEMADRAMADRLAVYVDSLRARYPAMALRVDSP